MAANSVGVVVGADGKRLYGMDAELYLKMQGDRDREWESKIEDWIEAVLGETDFIDRDDIWVSLKSGIVLCRLLNTIKPGVIPKYNKTRLLPLLEMDNIQIFLQAAWRLGLKASHLFTSADLYKKKSITAVYRCLYALQNLASSLGYKGAVIDDALTRAARKDFKKAKSWNAVETKPKKVRIDELVKSQGGPEAAIHALQLELAEANAKISKLKGGAASLRDQVNGLKDKLGQGGGKVAEQVDEMQRLRRELAKEKKEREQLEYEIGLVRKRVALSNKPKQASKQAEGRAAARTNDDESAALQAEIGRLRAKVQGFLAEKQAASTDSKNTRKKETELRQRLEQMRKESATSHRELDKENQRLRSRLEEALNQLANAGGEDCENAEAWQDLEENDNENEDKEVKFLPDEDESAQGSMTKESLEMARTRLKRMIAVGHSVEMDIKDLAALNSMFLTGAGRRAFVYILQENIKKSDEIWVTENNFQLCKALFDCVLQRLHDSNTMDYHTQSILMDSVLRFKLAGQIESSPSKKIALKCLQQERRIREHFADISPDFWEEVFWHRISHASSQMNQDSVDDKDDDTKEWTLSFLLNFARDLAHWGVSVRTAKDFVNGACESSALNLPSRAHRDLTKAVEKYWKQPKIILQQRPHLLENSLDSALQAIESARLAEREKEQQRLLKRRKGAPEKMGAIKQDFLHLYSGGMFTKWERKYCTVVDSVLNFYKSARDKTPAFQFRLTEETRAFMELPPDIRDVSQETKQMHSLLVSVNSTAEAGADQTKAHPFAIVTKTSSSFESLLLRADSAGERQEWIEAITDCVTGRVLDREGNGGLISLSPVSTLIKVKEKKLRIADLLQLATRMHAKSFGRFNRGIRTLDIRDCNFSPIASSFYNSLLPGCPSLTALHLPNNDLTDLGLKMLGSIIESNRLPNLELLDLQRNNITYVGGSELARALSHNDTVTEVCLSFNSIGDVGAQSFANCLQQNATLRVLKLNKCNLTNVAVRAFLILLDPSAGTRRVEINNLALQPASGSQRCAVGDCPKAKMGVGFNGQFCEYHSTEMSRLRKTRKMSVWGDGVNSTLERLVVSGNSGISPEARQELLAVWSKRRKGALQQLEENNSDDNDEEKEAAASAVT